MEEAGRSLVCGDALNVELVAARPSHFVFRFAVGAERNAFHWFRKPCRSNYTQPLLTHFASKDFLHVSSLPGNLIWRSPSSILSIQTPF